MQEGYLKLSVLKILSEQDCSGYELMKEIEETIGKKPSPGSMYPLLKALQRHTLITSKTRDRSTIYHITQQGRSLLKELLSHRQEMLAKVEQTHKFLEHFCGEKQPGMRHLFQRLLQGKPPFGPFTFDAIRFRDTLLRAANRDLSNYKKQQIKTLLQQTTKEIEHLCKRS